MVDETGLDEPKVDETGPHHLSHDQKIDTSVTTQTSSQLAALEPCTKAKVGTLLTN